MPDPSRYIIVRWTSADLALRPVANYLARVNADGTADVLRIIDAAEDMTKLIEQTQARDERLSNPSRVPIAQGRAQATAARTPPSKKEGLF